VTEAEIVVDKNVILDGEGLLSVDGNDDHRVFAVANGVSAELARMKVVRGRNQEGGGIRNTGTLTLRECEVLENQATGGAGIDNWGALTLIKTLVSRNRADQGTAWGGGISNWGSATLLESEVSDNYSNYFGAAVDTPGMLTIRDSVIAENEVGYDGGGITNYGSLFLENSRVSDNAGRAYGGGIDSSSTGLTMLVGTRVVGNSCGDGGGVYAIYSYTELVDSVVSNNMATGAVAQGNGGGIYNREGQLVLSGTTIEGNRAMVDSGGGIANEGVLTMTNVTLSSNEAAIAGGGVASGLDSFSGPVTMSMGGCTVSGNTAPTGSAIATTDRGPNTVRGSIIDGACMVTTPLTSSGGNIESPGDTCFAVEPTDQISVSTDALGLGPLADNGGLTETHALLPGSAAINKVQASMCLDAYDEALTTDQRGFPRDSMCDIGAFEVQP
jgi:hypothetical protein